MRRRLTGGRLSNRARQPIVWRLRGSRPGGAPQKSGAPALGIGAPTPSPVGCSPGAAVRDLVPLVQAAMAFRRLWRSIRPHHVCPALTAPMATQARSLAKALEAKFQRIRSKRWRDWIAKSCREGGRRVLLWVKRPEGHPQDVVRESLIVSLAASSVSGRPYGKWFKAEGAVDRVCLRL